MFLTDGDDNVGEVDTKTCAEMLEYLCTQHGA